MITASKTLAEIWSEQPEPRSDKSADVLRAYERELFTWREKPVKILEIGVGFGGGMRLWRDYFCSAHVVGVDREPLIKGGLVLRADQRDSEGLREAVHPHGPFDIIIDDGEHTESASCSAFGALFSDDEFLQPGGLYFVEDWGTSYWSEWPDGRAPTPTDSDVAFEHPSHHAGMVGWLKRLVDRCALPDVYHPRHGLPGKPKQFVVAGVRFWPGLAVVEKYDYV